MKAAARRLVGGIESVRRLRNQRAIVRALGSPLQVSAADQVGALLVDLDENGWPAVTAFA